MTQIMNINGFRATIFSCEEENSTNIEIVIDTPEDNIDRVISIMEFANNQHGIIAQSNYNNSSITLSAGCNSNEFDALLTYVIDFVESL